MAINVPLMDEQCQKYSEKAVSQCTSRQRQQWTPHEEQLLLSKMRLFNNDIEYVQKMYFKNRSVICLKRKFSRLTGTCKDSPLNRLNHLNSIEEKSASTPEKSTSQSLESEEQNRKLAFQLEELIKKLSQ